MRVVVIGNGVAGVTTARTLVENAPDHEVSIYTDEPYPYYPRPRLPALLAGELQLEDLFFYPENWYRKRGISVHQNARVTNIDPVNKKIILADGSTIIYDRLLLAMGSNAFIPPIEGTNIQGVFVLRSVKDALAIRNYAKGVRRAVVIGGGLLGLEAARSLKMLGLKTTVVEVLPRLLPKQLDPEGALILTRLIEALGINIITDRIVEAIIGSRKAEGVLFKGGGRIKGELILISAGVRPNIELAQAASIEVGRGVWVDDHMRTSAEDVYAAGDVAEFNHKIYGIIPAALEQAKVAGTNLATEKPSERYGGTIPYVTLKVVGIDLTSIGLVNPQDSAPGDKNYLEIRRSNENKGSYKKFVFKDGKIIGAILIGDRKNAAAVNKLITRKIPLEEDVEKLLEEDFDFKRLLR